MGYKMKKILIVPFATLAIGLSVDSIAVAAPLGSPITIDTNVLTPGDSLVAADDYTEGTPKASVYLWLRISDDAKKKLTKEQIDDFEKNYAKTRIEDSIKVPGLTDKKFSKAEIEEIADALENNKVSKTLGKNPWDLVDPVAKKTTNAVPTKQKQLEAFNKAHKLNLEYKDLPGQVKGHVDLPTVMEQCSVASTSSDSVQAPGAEPIAPPTCVEVGSTEGFDDPNVVQTL